MASIKYKDPETGQFITIPYYTVGGDPVAADKNYVYTQTTPSNIWSINHKLNKMPSVTLINSANEQIYGDVTYIDKNNIKVEFSAEVSGKAIMN